MNMLDRMKESAAETNAATKREWFCKFGDARSTKTKEIKPKTHMHGSQKEILKALSDGEKTYRGISRITGIPHKSLYYHVKQLVDAGQIIRSGQTTALAAKFRLVEDAK